MAKRLGYIYCARLAAFARLLRITSVITAAMAVSVSETKRLPQYSPVTSPATAPASCVQSVIYTMEMQSRTRLPEPAIPPALRSAVAAP